MPTTSAAAAVWDAAAGAFDDDADHGLRHAHVRSAWAARLSFWLPSPPADVVDLGCRTAFLSPPPATGLSGLTGL
jgi:hypothetical protein